MKTYRFTLQLKSAFGTPLVGDSLFGQLCWAIRHEYGESKLDALLANYREQPFAVISDAFPTGYLPLPTLPSTFWEKEENADRKQLKKKQWVAYQDSLEQGVRLWQKFAKPEKELLEKIIKDQPHNSLNRLTGTTGKDQFAPYSSSQTWYEQNAKLDLYIVIDEPQISAEQMEILLTHIGQFGFGRDATIGLGKFTIFYYEEIHYPVPENANAYLTLANCAPQNLALNKEHCFYQITTRFGRHGDIAALSENPFKKPIILAKTGAIFSPKEWREQTFIGNGLTQVSYSQTKAVHQGYAPVIPVAISFEK